MIGKNGMSVKETIVDCLVQSGYDFMTSCEYAADILQELKSYLPGIYTFVVGDFTLKIRKD